MLCHSHCHLFVLYDLRCHLLLSKISFKQILFHCLWSLRHECGTISMCGTSIGVSKNVNTMLKNVFHARETWRMREILEIMSQEVCLCWNFQRSSVATLHFLRIKWNDSGEYIVNKTQNKFSKFRDKRNFLNSRYAMPQRTDKVTEQRQQVNRCGSHFAYTSKRTRFLVPKWLIHLLSLIHVAAGKVYLVTAMRA